MKNWKSFLTTILNILFPPHCLNCKIENHFICPNCQKLLVPKTAQTCPYCQKASPFGKTCPNCQNKNKILNGLLVAGNYHKSPLLSELIKQLKFHYNTSLIKILSNFLKQIIPPNHKENIILTTVPLHWRRYAQRGFNQADLLARQLSQSTQIPYHPKLLRRIRHTPQQSLLPRQERLNNLKNAFRIKNSKIDSEKIYIIIDDVATTLTTLEECAQVLKKHGVQKVYGLVLARGK